MEYSNDIPPPQYNQQRSANYRTLQLNYKWLKSTGLITEPGRDEPLYIIDASNWKMKYKFRRGPTISKLPISEKGEVSMEEIEKNDTDLIGEGQTHGFKIDCACTIHGRPVTLSAASRLMTRYSYSSLAFASEPNKPVVMTWHGDSKVKWYDFQLKDESGEVVARFNTNYAGVRKLSSIEIIGPKANDPLALDEVVITSVMMYITMLYRTSNFVPLIGALTARSGKDFNVAEKEAREEAERNMAINSDQFISPYQPTINNPDTLLDKSGSDVKSSKVIA